MLVFYLSFNLINFQAFVANLKLYLVYFIYFLISPYLHITYFFFFVFFNKSFHFPCIYPAMISLLTIFIINFYFFPFFIPTLIFEETPWQFFSQLNQALQSYFFHQSERRKLLKRKFSTFNQQFYPTFMKSQLFILQKKKIKYN